MSAKFNGSFHCNLQVRDAFQVKIRPPSGIKCFWLNQLRFYLNLKPMQLKISDNFCFRDTTRYGTYI